MPFDKNGAALIHWTSRATGLAAAECASEYRLIDVA
jgi:hypothetical protein